MRPVQAHQPRHAARHNAARIAVEGPGAPVGKLAGTVYSQITLLPTRWREPPSADVTPHSALVLVALAARCSARHTRPASTAPSREAPQ